MRRSLPSVYLVLLWSILVAPASRADCIDYREYPHWTGGVWMWEPKDMTRSGDFVYAVSGGPGSGVFAVLDISVPDDPRLVGSVETEDYTYAVAVSGHYACVAEMYYYSRFNGVQIIDVANAQAPQIVSSLAIPESPRALAMSGSYVFMAEGNRFQVMDITNPAQPAIVADLDIDTYAGAISLSGHYAYLAGVGLTIVDIADPRAPVVTGSVGSFRAEALAVANSRASVIDGVAGFKVIDVANPHAPVVADSLDLTGRGVFASGNRVYATTWSGLAIIDVTDPTDVSVTCTCPWTGGDLFVSRDRVFIAGSYGLNVIDLGNCLSPPTLGSVPGSAGDVAVSGSRAYLASGSAGLQVIDVRNPEDPRILETIDTPGSARGVAIAQGNAYVADGPFGLVVIDVTTHSGIIGWVGTPGAANCVAIQGNRAYIGDESGLRVADISDPRNPWIMGSLGLPSEALRVVVSGPYAYVADYTAGFAVTDISDPADPVMVALIDEVMTARDLTLSGTYAYVASQAGVSVIDIAEPSNPQFLGTAWVADAAEGIAVAGDCAYVSTWGTFQVLDLVDPVSPRVIGSVGISGYLPHAIVVSNGIVYSTSWGAGLRILYTQCDLSSTMPGGSAVLESGSGAPLRVAPNPSTRGTVIRFDAPAAGPVRACIFDAAGRAVRRLCDGFRWNAGVHDLQWDGRDDAGRDVPAGVYLARVETAGAHQSARIVMVR
jgi:hypothetical protein